METRERINETRKQARSNPESRQRINQTNSKDRANRVEARQSFIGSDATEDDLLRSEVPSDPNWFFDASSSAIKTLLLFLYNSGHSFLPHVAHNQLPHSTDVPAILKDVWEDADDIPDEVRQLHSKLLELVVTDETKQRRVEAFGERIQLDGVLPSCASCGIRDQFIAEETLLQFGQKQRACKPDKHDLFALKPQPAPYVRIGLDHPLLEPLKYTPEQIAERAASGFPEVFSAYEYRRGDGELVAIYHLHQQLVETSAAGGEPQIILCRQCVLFLQKSKPRDASQKPRSNKAERNAQGFIERCYCIARGYDYGNISGMPELSLLEKILLGQYCFFGQLIKLNGWKGVKQRALRGHVIAYEHAAPNAINRLSHMEFPWYETEEVVQCVRVAFVGPSGVAERCLKALCIDDCGLLRVDLRPLKHWLRLLKAVHPGYTHIVLPRDDGSGDEIQARLLDMQRQIIAGAQVVTSKLSKKIESKAGADIAQVRSMPDDHDCEDEMESDIDSNDAASRSSSSSTDNSDKEAELIDLDNDNFDRNLNIVLDNTIIINGAKSSEQSSRDVLAGLLSTMTRNPDTGEVPAMHLINTRSENPINEHGNNDVLHAMAFPDLFIFGRGLPLNSYAFKPKFLRHLYLQFHCRFARNARFYYVNFNQLQRHSVAGLAATRVRNSKPAMQAFIRLVHEDNFMARLSAAVADPDGEESKLFMKQVLPLLSNFGQTVPYSPPPIRA